MSTESLERIESLNQLLDSTLETFSSTQELLDVNNQLLDSAKNNTQATSTSDIQLLKKKYILDSFKINKAQKEFKDWEVKCKNDVIENEAGKYNETLGEISRINLRIDKASNTYETLSNSIELPKFIVSRRTLESLNNDALLKAAQSDGDEVPRHVLLSDLFSLDSSSDLPLPDFKVISQLINIEYRLRLEKMLKLEVLTLIKQKLDNENRTWSKYLNSLNQFVNKSVPEAIAEVEKIKAEEADVKLKKIQIESDSLEEEEDIEVQDVDREEEGEHDEVLVHTEEEEEDEENNDDVDEYAKDSDEETRIHGHDDENQTESHISSPRHDTFTGSNRLGQGDEEEDAAVDGDDHDDDHDDDMLTDH